MVQQDMAYAIYDTYGIGTAAVKNFLCRKKDITSGWNL